MKIEINEDLCIGCGACQGCCDEVFNLSDDTGLAQANNDKINESNIDDVKDAIEGCPTGAIEEK